MSSDQGSGESNDGTNESVQIRAITFPSDTGSLPNPPQPRQPRNLQDLLRYSTEVTAASGGSDGNSSNFRPLTEESRKFLEEALNSMTIDVIAELMKSIKILQKADISEDYEEQEEALDHLFDFVDNLDIANDFHKIGGFSVLQPCLNSPKSSVRWRGAELIAELCKNNPYCQEKSLESKLLPLLMNMVDSDENDTVRVKAMYAVSSLLRHSDDALNEFSENDGYSVLLRALQSGIEKLIIKAAFLLSGLCFQKPEIKDDLVKMGYVEQLVGQLANELHLGGEEYSQIVEHLMSALLSLIHDHSPSQSICRNPELQLKELMNTILKHTEGKKEYLEQNEYAQNCLSIVWKDEGCEHAEDR